MTALAPIHLPERHERTLPNGLWVSVAERRLVPLVCAYLVLRHGSARDPKGKAGLSDFTVELLRRGTKTRSADDIDELLELTGGDLRLETDHDATYLSITCPSEHLPPLLELVADLLMSPEFAAQEVAQAKKRGLANIANDLDNPGLIASDALYRLAFGKHPYGRPGHGTTKEVASFTRKDCQSFYATYFRPDSALLTVVGDVDPNETHELVARLFGPWKASGKAPKPLPEVEPLLGRHVLLVDKPESSQAQVRLASRGYDRRHPDMIPARVSCQVFGGGFTSRLVDEVRVNRGLTYGIGAHIQENELGGLFSISSFTKTESARELVDVTLELAKKYRETGPTAEELSRSTRYINGLFPLALETVESMARIFADQKRFERPPEWIQNWRQMIAAVTTEQAREVARKYFLADGEIIVVLGDAKALKKQLASLGKLKVVPIEAYA